MTNQKKCLYRMPVGMRCLPWLVIGWLLAGTRAQAATFLLVVVGAGGTDEYAAEFQRWAQQCASAATRAGAEVEIVGLDEDSTGTSDRDRVLDILRKRANTGTDPLWIVLFGHGTFDGQTAKFNLRGPDISAGEFAAELGGSTRPLVFVNCSSASGPFINALSGPNRVIITATKSGFEVNYARFGGYFAEALDDVSGDLDKDEQVSVLEAFVAAGGRVAEFYASENRLATEHALLDDNGDALGTPADWFRGTRATQSAAAGQAIDGGLANRMVLAPSERERRLSDEQRARRDELEQKLAALRARKSELPEGEYDALLEPVLLEIAEIYENAERTPNRAAE